MWKCESPGYVATTAYATYAAEYSHGFSRRRVTRTRNHRMGGLGAVSPSLAGEQTVSKQAISRRFAVNSAGKSGCDRTSEGAAPQKVDLWQSVADK